MTAKTSEDHKRLNWFPLLLSCGEELVPIFIQPKPGFKRYWRPHSQHSRIGGSPNPTDPMNLKTNYRIAFRISGRVSKIAHRDKQARERSIPKHFSVEWKLGWTTPPRRSMPQACPAPGWYILLEMIVRLRGGLRFFIADTIAFTL